MTARFLMTDAELGAELYPRAPHVGAWIAHHMAPAKRATMERLVEVGQEANLWTAGAGPKPTGVILCGPKQIRKAGKG